MHSASISPSGQRPRHMPGSRCGQRHCSTSGGWPPPAGHTPSGSLAAAALSACSLVALPSLLLSSACTRKPPRQQRLVWVAPGQLSVRSVMEQLRPCLSPRRRCRCARVRGANSSYSLAVPVHRTSRVPLPSAPARMHTYSPSASSISAARSRSRWARHPDLQRRSPSPCALRNCKRAQYVKATSGAGTYSGAHHGSMPVVDAICAAQWDGLIVHFGLHVVHHWAVTECSRHVGMVHKQVGRIQIFRLQQQRRECRDSMLGTREPCANSLGRAG